MTLSITSTRASANAPVCPYPVRGKVSVSTRPMTLTHGLEGHGNHLNPGPMSRIVSPTLPESVPRLTQYVPSLFQDGP